jgi:putative endopeptidase
MARLSTCAALLLAGACSPAPSRQAPHAPQYGAWGIDLAGRDTTVRPGDDFFDHVNGGWLARTAIPADKTGITLRLLMNDTTEARLHAIMEAAAARAAHAPTDLEGKVGAYYKAFMDSTRVEQLGASPLAPQLARVRTAGTREAIAALMGHNNLDFNGTIFSSYIEADLRNPKVYSVYLNQAGLGLPDRDYYLKPGFASPRAAYQRYAATLLHLIDWPEADARAADILAFETAIARASWTKVQQRDVRAEYNPMTVADLVRLAPGFDWQGYLESADLPHLPRVIVGEKSAVPRIAAVFASTPVRTLQAWEAFTLADNAAPFLARPFGDAYFEMRQKTLGGQQAQGARWKRAVHAVSGGDVGTGSRFDRFGSMGFGVGQLYTAKYFPPAARATIEELVSNLKAAYRARIERLDWMSPATRQEALKKLDTYTIKVGYPDHPRDYSTLLIRDDDLLGDVQRVGALDWRFYVGRLNGPVDRTDWLMTPQTNDAYNGSLRDIVFPAGILQPPIFDPNADMAVNYGAAGSIIGHELTHGFDDEGRKIDAAGILRDWWQPADARVFEARAHELAAQYSTFEPLPGLHVNGSLTLGENIADLGGVTLALDAYRASLHGAPAPVLDGLTGEQRVFLGWAQAWRGKVTDDYVKQQVVSDPHSPRRFRVNGPLRNVDAWYTAFDVKPGESLYVAPTNRVHIW